MKPITIIKKDIKNINLRVKPNCDVILSVPLKTTDAHIQYVLNKRADWIDAKLAFYKTKPSPFVKQYVSGENVKFLGRNYRLKVIQSEQENVKLQGGYLNLYIKNKDNFNKKKFLVKNWYADKTKKHFQKAINKYQPIINKKIQHIRIRRMKTRWGSCNPEKSYINLNCELIKAPTQCIEYVVFHELSHLLYPNHDKHFYNYLHTHIPNWKQIKDKLEGGFYV